MAEDKTNNNSGDNKEFTKLLEKETINVPKVGDIVKGTVLSASKAEVKLDLDGIFTGVVRGQELYGESAEYANLKPGDEIEATVVEEENENGEMELSFRFAGQKKAWSNLLDALENKKTIKVKITGANRGGLLAIYEQINGFLPVSQLSPEKYPRVSGGDKNKILEKLKSYVDEEFEVMVVNLGKDGKEEKIIFSEKDVWSQKQRSIIDKYKVGAVIEGKITAIAKFGVFVAFGENLEGLIHISELAWQRIDDPAYLFKVGDKIKAEVISVDGSKIFLSAKKLIQDPWKGVEEKYKVGQVVAGVILKVNPFGLFVKLDDEIHGLAHISQLNLAPEEKINDIFKAGDKIDFTISSMEPREHRLGLIVDRKSFSPKASDNKEKKSEEKEKKSEDESKKSEKAKPEKVAVKNEVKEKKKTEKKTKKKE